MSEPLGFEDRLALALRHRADRAPVQVDPYAVARAAATARRADPVLGRMFEGGPRGLARMLLTAVLLALLAAAGLFIGSRLTEPERTMGRVVDAGRMSVEREGHTATRLLDGRVLLVGGDEPPSAELYDPATGTFTRAGSLSTAQRFGMAAALLHDGRVLIVGGMSMEGDDVTRWPLAFGEIYDPATGTFSRTAPVVQPRAYLRSALTLPDGRVMLAGGAESSTNLVSVELFDPATGAFVPGGSMLVGRSGHTLSLLADGRVLVAGGWGPDGLTAVVEIYDPTKGTSVRTGDMATPRAYHAAVQLADGRVLFIGGTGGPDHTALSSIEAFDPATGTFSEVGRLITERSGPNALALDDGRVLVAGGNNTYGDPRTVEIFDPAAEASTVVGRIVPGQDMGNDFSVTTTLLADGSVLLAGGNGLQVARFDPRAAPIVATPPSPRMPIGSTALDGPAQLRTGHTATRLADGRVLIAGGADGGTGPVLASAEVFDPVSGATSATGTMSAPRTGHAAALLADGRVLVVGGLADAYPTESWPSMELYDPATGTFTASEYMTVPQAGRTPPSQAWYDGVRPTAIALPDGRVLVVGWDPGRIDDPVGSLQLYDPASGTLSAVDVPSGILVRGVWSALLPDGRLLFLDGDHDILEAIVYDPVSGSWEREGTTAPRIAFTATVVDGRVLIVGGRAGSGSWLATAEVWDPVTGRFSATGDPSAGRIRHAATMLADGRVLITGGYGYEGTRRDHPAHPAPEVWDPVSKTFSVAPALAAERAGHTATLLDDGRVLLVGGVARPPDRDDPIPPSAEWYAVP